MLATGDVPAVVTLWGAPMPSGNDTRTLTCAPTSAWTSVYEPDAAPPMALPLRSHWYENAPSPSASASEDAFAARTWPCVAVPVTVTLPVGASFTFATAAVAVDATLSGVANPSV